MEFEPRLRGFPCAAPVGNAVHVDEDFRIGTVLVVVQFDVPANRIITGGCRHRCLFTTGSRSTGEQLEGTGEAQPAPRIASGFPEAPANGGFANVAASSQGGTARACLEPTEGFGAHGHRSTKEGGRNSGRRAGWS